MSFERIRDACEGCQIIGETDSGEPGRRLVGKEDLQCPTQSRESVYDYAERARMKFGLRFSRSACSASL
jgi:hypothetical protein